MRHQIVRGCAVQVPRMVVWRKGKSILLGAVKTKRNVYRADKNR